MKSNRSNFNLKKSIIFIFFTIIINAGINHVQNYSQAITFFSREQGATKAFLLIMSIRKMLILTYCMIQILNTLKFMVREKYKNQIKLLFFSEHLILSYDLLKMF